VKAKEHATKFEEALAADPGIVDALRAWVLAKKKCEPTEVDDVAQNALTSAVAAARSGKDYVPGEPALARKALAKYLTPFLQNALSERARRFRRKPSEAVGDGAEFADESASAEDHASAVLAMRRLREGVADQSNAHLLLGILDAYREGCDGPTELSTRLKCTVADIAAACKRLTRCAQRIAEGDAS
jgi:hypothetical protein